MKKLFPAALVLALLLACGKQDIAEKPDKPVAAISSVQGEWQGGRESAGRAITLNGFASLWSATPHTVPASPVGPSAQIPDAESKPGRQADLAQRVPVTHAMLQERLNAIHLAKRGQINPSAEEGKVVPERRAGDMVAPRPGDVVGPRPGDM